MAAVYVLRLEGIYTKENGQEIYYSKEKNAETTDILTFIGFQKYYLGERYSDQLMDEIVKSLKSNFPHLHWVKGPVIRVAPPAMGMKVSVGFWGQKEREGYQFLCIVNEGIITRIYIRTIFDE